MKNNKLSQKEQQKLLKEKYKVKEIISERKDNLSISMDCDDNWDEVKQRFPVMLFTPDMDNTNEH